MAEGGQTLTDSGASYSPLVGLVFVFNLIVGTGALAMPRAFQAAGWLFSTTMIIALGFMSYVTATFVIESMAAANAITHVLKEDENQDEGNRSVSEEQPLLNDYQSSYEEDSSLLPGPINWKQSPFKIARRIEMGHMASLFFNKVGVNLFYLSIALYLYGDLAIYMAAVPKSLRNVVCTYKGNLSENGSLCNESLTNQDPCWDDNRLSRMDVYRIFVAVFFVLLSPFVFFNVQKTKYLQMFTTLMRWLAFSMMIILALMRIGKGQGEGHPVVADLSGVPTLFGVCVYSFMCHHSLPSLVTPIKDKSRLSALFAFDYTIILGFYALLSFTAIFSFRDLQDVYTLNFQPGAACGGEAPITHVIFVQYFLALFPVFTLSTNIPIIGITLRNNLKALCQRWAPFPTVVDRIAFPLAAVLVPLVPAFATDSVEFLVGVTGSYAGAAVQYFVPAALVLCSRKLINSAEFEDQLSCAENMHRSPFGHVAWVYAVLVWGVLCIAFVTANFAIHGI